MGLLSKAKRVWSRKPEAERKPVRRSKTKTRKPDSRADTSGPPLVEEAIKGAVKDAAELQLEQGNALRQAALGGFAPELTAEDIKDEVRATEKAEKQAEGRKGDPEAQAEVEIQTATAHRAALGGFAFAGGTEAEEEGEEGEQRSAKRSASARSRD